MVKLSSCLNYHYFLCFEAIPCFIIRIEYCKTKRLHRKYTIKSVCLQFLRVKNVNGRSQKIMMKGKLGERKTIGS